MDAQFVRTNIGLMPADDESREWFSKVTIGRVIQCKVSQPRNVVFHRKWFALMRYSFDYWSEIAPRVEYKGEEVHPDFDRFRRDITILAGKFHTTVNLKGEVRLEADSVSFGSMNAEDFEELYSKTIDVLLTRVFTAKRWSAEKLRSVVEGLVEFA